MFSNKKMVSFGQWWFRYRSYSPLPLLIIAVFYPFYDVTRFSFNIAFGIIFILIGELGRTWCVGYAGGITRTRSGDLHSLITAGPFYYVRNPIYIFNMIMYAGVTLALNVPVIVPFMAVYFFTQYSFIVAYEEQILEEKFGAEYLNYKNKVSRWIPKFSNIKRSSHPFLLKEALKSERKTINAIFVVILISVAKYFICRSL